MEDAPPSAPARLSDVARLAGVSPATVSRALSRPDLVSRATRAAVEAAVAASGYRVNHAARNLRRQRTGVVLALVPNLGNPFFARILGALGARLAPEGTGLMVADSAPENGRHPGIGPFLDPTRCDGVVLFDGAVPRGFLDAPARRPVLVMACEWLEGAALPAVVVDNEAGGAAAVAHLAGLGHRRVALLRGPEANVLTAARAAGAARAAAGCGVALEDLAGDFTLAAGVAAARRWLAAPPAARATAVFAFSDSMACGFMAEAMRAGVTVPGEVSVVGFDDIELAPHLWPALTTIRQPREAIGRRAAETVLARIAGERGPPVREVLPVELVVRASTAPAGLSGRRR